MLLITDTLTREDNNFRFKDKAVHLAHPREIADAFAKVLLDQKNASWFD